MCMQCVADGGLYVGGAVGALQVMKVRAARRRAAASAPAADGHADHDAQDELEPAT